GFVEKFHGHRNMRWHSQKWEGTSGWKHSPGGARAGHALLMRPKRPLPVLPFAKMPLRRNPNDAAAIIAAKVTRGHCTSAFARVRRSARTLILVRVDGCVNGVPNANACGSIQLNSHARRDLS